MAIVEIHYELHHAVGVGRLMTRLGAGVITPRARLLRRAGWPIMLGHQGIHPSRSGPRRRRVGVLPGCVYHSDERDDDLTGGMKDHFLADGTYPMDIVRHEWHSVT